MVFVSEQLAADGLLRHGSGGGGLRQRRLARHLRRLRHRAEPALSQQPRRHVPGDRGPRGVRVRRERGRPGRRWASGVGDYDADGWLDIVRTNFSEQVTTLYRNYGSGFEDASLRAGLGVNRKYVGFGVGFLDFDNDGWLDILMANGHVYSQIEEQEPPRQVPGAQAPLPQPGERAVRGRLREGGSGDPGREPRPRLRLRGLRQRRRRGRGREQPGRASDAAPQRRRERQPLDPGQVRGHPLEPFGDRHPREGSPAASTARSTRS